MAEATSWQVVFNGGDEYEVKCGRKQFKVNIAGRTCGCSSWDLTGIPCCHAIYAIFDDGGQPEEYIDECYSKVKYLSTYEHTL